MPANGFLQIRVFTSQAKTPIRGAAVNVTERLEKGSRLLAAEITDENGLTGVLALPAPEASLSQSPGAQQPWRKVDITVDQPRYERILVENVQIFAGTLTEQELELIPYGEMPESWSLTEIFDVSAQPL